ncbi:hypothetical protein PRECH8_14340 [Insulibacter thermoxylanivorax]|uniref:Uncharacterized protein n=1 Tax=Insulibacter thermoxylanivorax TaxID=2749268 RepID=A0A916VFQ6_9BACL|nr:hypothetical protein PRECH8_14340 [Insulibacter thermoxylanivorax]
MQYVAYDNIRQFAATIVNNMLKYSENSYKMSEKSPTSLHIYDCFRQHVPVQVCQNVNKFRLSLQGGVVIEVCRRRFLNIRNIIKRSD